MYSSIRSPEESVESGVSAFNRLMSSAGFEEKEHQVSGVRWCLEKEHNASPPCNVRGGIVADEMGLGKTNMMLGTVLGNLMSKTLIVVPPSLLNQWQQAVKKLGGDPVIWHGPEKNKIPLQELEHSLIVLTTYGSIASNQKRPCVLHNIVWNRVVFDEAHHLRNKNTSKHKGALAIRAPIRWLVTGTPIQNSRKDFYALCNCLGLPPSFYRDAKNLPLLATNFLLKRTKKEVGVEYPEAVEVSNIVEWENEDEKSIAMDVHARLGFCNIAPRNRTLNPDADHLKMMCRARQMCVLPSLLAPMVQEEIVNGNIDEEDYETLKAGLASESKLKKVVGVLRNGPDNKGATRTLKLVFCHYRKELDRLQELLTNEHISSQIVDGRTGKKKRDNLLASPSSEVLLLQIQSCSEGLNLQEYSEVYFVSPHWNPAVEAQAIGRCHRMGQTNQVKVFHFQMASFDAAEEELTLDNYATKVQENKRDISEMVVVATPVVQPQ